MKHTLLLLILLGFTVLCVALPRNLVVMEIGTGTWCQYCPGAAMGADELIANNKPVAIIENHNGDNYANTYSNSRNSYYQINGFPTAEFDGLNPVVGGSNTQSMYSSYLPRVTTRMNAPSHYSITASGSITGNNFSINAVVSKPEADTNTNVVLHCVITESEIQTSWQGQDHLNFVNRLMLPNQTGTPVNLGTGEQQTFTLNGTFNTDWDMNNCELVLFVQNSSTKEVLQGYKYSLPGLLGVYPASVQGLQFPQTYLGGTNTMPVTLHNFHSTAVTGAVQTTNPAFVPAQANFTIEPHSVYTMNVDFTPTIAQLYTAALLINSNIPGYNSITIGMTGQGFVDQPPVATNVTVSGPPVIYQNLTANYSYSDPDAHTEGNTQFQWMRMMNGTPTPIDNATAQVYNTQVEDLGWQLACRVTPCDQWGMLGTPVLSTLTQAIVDLPAPRNLTGSLTPPSTVLLTWQRPEYFDTRGFIGYRVYRNGATHANLMNPGTLSYTDTNVPSGTNEYWVVAIYNNPLNYSIPSNSVTIEVSVANSDELAPGLSGVTAYPNPFRQSARIGLSTKAHNPVRVEIFNLKGQMVYRANTRSDANGKASLEWDGMSLDGSHAQAGLYFYRVYTDSESQTGRLILLK